MVGRLQLGVYAREGEARLVSTGDPQRDLFHEYAHRFRVFVPAGWVRTAEQERMLRRAIEAEKPAHTAYDLCLVEPRFRVGVQSTVGSTRSSPASRWPGWPAATGTTRLPTHHRPATGWASTPCSPAARAAGTCASALGLHAAPAPS